MRKFLFLPLLALLASCGKDEDYDRSNPKPEEMVTPALYATIQQNTTDLYNGPLEVLPCRPDGSIYVETTKINLDGMIKYLQIEQAKGQELTIVLRADQAAQYGGFVQVLDTLKQMNITKIAIATESK